MKNVRQALPCVTQPCLIMQSTNDHVMAPKNMDRIFESVGSAIKRQKYIEKAYHTFISDIKNEHVFFDILNFLEEN